MSSFTTTTDGALEGQVDLARALRELPDDYAMKGMFFERQRIALGAAWPEVRAALAAPPGRAYSAFESYPMADYLKLFVRVAEDRFGVERSREGVRLLARGEVEVFAGSTLGKVTFAMLREPGAALLRYPDASGALVRGPSFFAERNGDRRVTLRFVRYHGIVEYVVGALEGLVLAFEATPTIDVAQRSSGDLILVVSW